MARYFSIRRSRQRGRSRRWIYLISALVIIAAAIAFIYFYRPFGEDETPVVVSIDTAVPSEKEVIPSVLLEPEPELPVIPPDSIAEPNSEATELIAKAMTLVNAKPAKIINARDILNDALSLPMSRQQRWFVKDQLSELADKWLFSRRLFPQDNLCESYRVKSGDILKAIGKRYKVPYEILMEINNIPSAEALRAGETIKVINGPFHARIYRSSFTMDLYLQGTFVRSFPVGLGQPGMETPTGPWRVRPGGKLISPTWTDPISGKTYEAEDTDYPLGSRWIGLEGIAGEAKGRTGFAIHGTKDPEEIGTARSQGCIRLHNGDAILIYNLLMPGISRVEIVE